jgi:hypothetical protein
MRIHGISFYVVWELFGVGTSFFIPCLDANEARKKVKEVANRLGYKIVTKSVIEENIKGLRVWRVK